MRESTYYCCSNKPRRANIQSLVLMMMVWLLVMGGVARAAVVYFTVDGSGVSSTFGTHRWKVEYEEGEAIDGFDVLVAAFGAAELIGGNEYRLGSSGGNHVLLSNYGSELHPNYFINTIVMNGVSLTNTNEPPFSPSWTQLVDGGWYGWPTVEADEDLGEWDFGSGMMGSNRIFADGSFEAYVYGDYELPSYAPDVLDFVGAPTVYIGVPEPSRWVLMMAGVVWVGLRRRRERGWSLKWGGEA